MFIERGVEGGRGRVHSKKASDFCEDWPVGHQTETVEKRFKFDIAVTSGPGPFCFTSTETRLLIRGRDGGEEHERGKGQLQIPLEKDQRDRGPLPEQWKC